MQPPPPTRAFLAAQIRWAMGRGLPPQIAEDVVFTAWEKASARFDPKRGAFEPFMQKIVRTECAGFWRRTTAEARARRHLHLLPTPSKTSREERAERNQQALLDALDPERKRVFHAWALQRHLGKGRISAAEIAASIGLKPREYDNAKRRLRDHLHALLDRFGWTVEDVLHGESDVDRTG